MFRTGIYKLEQLRNGRLKDLFGSEKNISLRTYYELKNAREDEREKLAEIILNRFNSANNVIKRTYRERFNAFDQACLKIIREQQFAKLHVHDMAISDGRASHYFLAELARSFTDVRYTGSDIAVSYRVFEGKLPGHVIVDPGGKIVEIALPPFVWNYSRKTGMFYFLDNAIKTICHSRCAKLLEKGRLRQKENIEIVDDKFRELIGGIPGAGLRNHNLLHAQPEFFEVIRAMNILHYGYFSDEQFILILENIYNGLADNGIFIEGSNEDAGSEVEGGIYQKTPQGFKLLKQAERPSRILERVLAFRKK